MQMRNSSRFRIFTLLAVLCFALWTNAQTMWYNQPAADWMQSLPLGNGRVGAQVWGQVDEETLSVNESSMWSGWYNPSQAPRFGAEQLQQVRKLFFEGKVAEANELCFKGLQGDEAGFGTHLPLGELKVTHRYAQPLGQLHGYRRQLDLSQAVAGVSYMLGDVAYSTQYFSSNPADLIVVRYTASAPGSISFDLSAQLLRKQATVSTSQGELVIQGVCRKDAETQGGVRFLAHARLVNEGGTLSSTPTSVSVQGADAVTLLINLTTDWQRPDTYRQACTSAIDAASSQPYSALLSAHVQDWTRLFSRVSLQLGDPSRDLLPTDVRWQQLRQGRHDPALQALFFHYGRYLTASASRHNSPLPIALQGFFNDNRACNMGWNNDYHLDINTQQNYWLANVGNLAECNAPLYTYIQSLAQSGQKTVQTMYDIQEGWTAHTTANIWGFTAPCGVLWWGLHTTGGSWLATHLWEDFTFTHDTQRLLTQGYPLLKGNAQFLLSYLVRDPRTGYLVTGPSISPENSFGLPDGGNWPASLMPTVDRVMVWEIFHACIRASEILGIDKSFAAQLRKAIAQLPPYQENKYGGLREWMEDYDDIHPNHRHTSHLLGLYPYSQLSLQRTPQLCRNAYSSLQRRLTAQGWEDVEWSRALAICYSARLQHAQEAYESINMLLSKLARENLLTVSPEGIAGAPYDIFSFDGNTAGAAGMAEMLVQSHEGYVQFLPALPREWAEGSFRGLCVRGGAQVSASWSQGQLTHASLQATAPGQFRILLPAHASQVLVNGHKPRHAALAGQVFQVRLRPGDVVEIR